MPSPPSPLDRNRKARRRGHTVPRPPAERPRRPALREPHPSAPAPPHRTPAGTRPPGSCRRAGLPTPGTTATPSPADRRHRRPCAATIRARASDASLLPSRARRPLPMLRPPTPLRRRDPRPAFHREPLLLRRGLLHCLLRDDRLLRLLDLPALQPCPDLRRVDLVPFRQRQQLRTHSTAPAPG